MDSKETQIIEKAVSVLNAGGVIIYPTDTAFGIGCRIDNPAAVDRLFALRKRPVTKATPLLVASKDMALKYFVNPGDTVRLFMETYWPGQLTIVSVCDVSKVYSKVRGGGHTVGMRMPNHNIITSIIEKIGVPVLGPSANFHGEETPYVFESLNAELMRLVDFVVPGKCSVKAASTVVDCSVDPYVILRQGAVDL